MRIVVISDIHGAFRNLEFALDAQRKAQAVIFLGDGERDMDQVMPLFPQFQYYSVRGNCDFGSVTPVEGEAVLASRRIFYTHGHLYQVKYGYSRILEEGRRRKADIVLFGHTHEACAWYEDGVYLMNPGSLGHPQEGGPSYGVIDITSAGIVTNLIELL